MCFVEGLNAVNGYKLMAWEWERMTYEGKWSFLLLIAICLWAVPVSYTGFMEFVITAMKLFPSVISIRPQLCLMLKQPFWVTWKWPGLLETMNARSRARCQIAGLADMQNTQNKRQRWYHWLLTANGVNFQQGLAIIIAADNVALSHTIYHWSSDYYHKPTKLFEKCNAPAWLSRVKRRTW